MGHIKCHLSTFINKASITYLYQWNSETESLLILNFAKRLLLTYLHAYTSKSTTKHSFVGKKNHLSLRHSRLRKRKTKICQKLNFWIQCFITERNTLSKFSRRNQHKLVHSLCWFTELHPSRHRRIHYNEFCSRKSNYHLKVLHIQGLNKLWSILITSKPNQERKVQMELFTLLFKDACHHSTSNWTHSKNTQGTLLPWVYRVSNMIITCREVFNTA